MKVFISWSGEKSRQIAERLQAWISSVNQHIETYFTPDDIQKGARWGSEIAYNLQESDFGIICLTQDNLAAPWILFEAGALSKNLDTARVCPVLFGVGQQEISGPLTQFQSVNFEKSDIRKLMQTMNQLKDGYLIPKDRLDKSFDIWWSELDAQVGDIISGTQCETETRRSDSDIMLEILSNSRAILRSIEGGQRPQPSSVEMELEILISGWEDVVVSAESTDAIRPNYKAMQTFQKLITEIYREQLSHSSIARALLGSVDTMLGKNDPRHRFQLGDAADMYGSE